MQEHNLTAAQEHELSIRKQAAAVSRIASLSYGLAENQPDEWTRGQLFTWIGELAKTVDQHASTLHQLADTYELAYTAKEQARWFSKMLDITNQLSVTLLTGDGEGHVPALEAEYVALNAPEVLRTVGFKEDRR
ncbi:hypothetical protein [Saccharomonospora glauca]|uniref:Uncharacterized protein n=1 Tax=Saccharomonospora glauca K62 TaxID=928724 RepID=I1CZF9_9PSEU|nr:hypothetical protein [Saccharomonospora glauca]EIE98083.1 hypothetical protein SacglDRAFT_01150 [Saccharomonospora glauca K62]